MKKKWLYRLVVFFLGLCLGLVFMVYNCDWLLGSRLVGTRTRVRVSSLAFQVEGGVVTGVKPGLVRIRATSLDVKLSFARNGGGDKAPVVMELENLPRGFSMTSVGDGSRVLARGVTSLALYFPVSRVGEEGTLEISPGRIQGDYTFWVAGDNRDTRKFLASMLKKAALYRPLFIVLGGDLVGEGFYWEYKRLLGDLDHAPVPVFVVPGNHDLKFCGRRYFTRLLAPDHYYFTYGDDLFVVLDTNGKDGGQLGWLEGILKGHTYRHIFVFVHKPPFDPRPGRSHAMGDRGFAKALLRLLVKYRVDVLFCSHIHSFIEASYKSLRIVITGGLGAHRKEPMKPFHYVQVDVKGQGVKVDMIPLGRKH